jgi:hypothetical protein
MEAPRYNVSNPAVLGDYTLSLPFRTFLEQLTQYASQQTGGGLQPGDNVSELVNDAGYLTEVTNEIATLAAANKTLVNREFCTATVGGIVLTLPASPNPADYVRVNTLTASNIVINPGLNNLQGLNESMTIDIPNFVWRITFVDTVNGWWVG